MDTPRGNVYTFQQSTFWRFTKFCGKLGLVIWASWSTYVFIYHRPMLQRRTQQLEEVRDMHERQMTDLEVYLQKFNQLTKELNVIDDKIVNAEKLTDSQKENLINDKSKIWGELDFLKTRLTERENEVLKLLVQGKSNTQIAQELIVSVHTAKAHVCSILQKLCVDDRVQAAVKAIKEGIVSV